MVSVRVEPSVDRLGRSRDATNLLHVVSDLVRLLERLQEGKKLSRVDGRLILRSRIFVSKKSECKLLRRGPLLERL